jgi:hypothetical protein
VGYFSTSELTILLFRQRLHTFQLVSDSELDPNFRNKHLYFFYFFSSSTLASHSGDHKKGARSSNGAPLSSYRERESFLKKYDSMSLDEVSAALMVTRK